MRKGLGPQSNSAKVARSNEEIVIHTKRIADALEAIRDKMK